MRAASAGIPLDAMWFAQMASCSLPNDLATSRTHCLIACDGISVWPFRLATAAI